MASSLIRPAPTSSGVFSSLLAAETSFMDLARPNTLDFRSNGALMQKPPPSTAGKRVYFCQRCLNHGRHEPRKNHKCDCPFAACKCEKCLLVEKRRQLNSALHDLEDVPQPNKAEAQPENLDVETTDSNSSFDDAEPRVPRIKGERIPNCQKCGQHGRKNRLKGHKRVCPFKDCTCPKCQVVSERQKLMADQIKIRRRQRKDTLMNLTRESITATLNALGQLPSSGMSSLQSALIYNQIKSPVPQPLSSSGSSSYSPPCSAASLSTDISSLLLNIPGVSTSTNILDPLLLPLTTSLDSMSTATASLPPSLTSLLHLPPSASDTIGFPLGLPTPLTPCSTSSFSFPLNDQLLQQILLNYQLLSTESTLLPEPVKTIEENISSSNSPETTSSNNNAIIDVCSV